MLSLTCPEVRLSVDLRPNQSIGNHRISVYNKIGLSCNLKKKYLLKRWTFFSSLIYCYDTVFNTPKFGNMLLQIILFQITVFDYTPKFSKN